MKIQSYLAPVVAAVLGIGLPAWVTRAASAEPETSAPAPAKRVATLRPFHGTNVRGTVVLEESASEAGVWVRARVGGLFPNQTHALCLHQLGDLSKENGEGAGECLTWRSPAAEPDVAAGFLGNLTADLEGNAELDVRLEDLPLDSGHDPLLGRSIVVHAPDDDSADGPGERMAGGVIGIAYGDASSP